VTFFHLTLSRASIKADLLNTERLEYHISNLRCSINITGYSPLRILDRHRFITAPVDFEGILKMEGALTRLSNANLLPPTTSPSSLRPQHGGGGGEKAAAMTPRPLPAGCAAASKSHRKA
jgi:hypothetical protein